MLLKRIQISALGEISNGKESLNTLPYKKTVLIGIDPLNKKDENQSEVNKEKKLNPDKLKEKKTVPITDKEREIFNLNNNRKGTVKNKSKVKSKKKKTQYKNRRK